MRRALTVRARANGSPARSDQAPEQLVSQQATTERQHESPTPLLEEPFCLAPRERLTHGAVPAQTGRGGAGETARQAQPKDRSFGRGGAAVDDLVAARREARRAPVDGHEGPEVAVERRCVPPPSPAVEAMSPRAEGEGRPPLPGGPAVTAAA